jgi:integrase
MARTAGQIKPHGEDRWLVSVYLGRDVTGRRLYQSHTVHGGRRAAEKKLREVLHQKDAGRLVRPDRRPVGEYLDWWLSNVVRARVRASTFASHEALVATYLKPELGAVRLDKLTTFQAQALVRKLTERGLSPRTVRYALAILNGALRKAYKVRLLPWNPMEEVELPRQLRRELQVPGEAARARLLAELQPDTLWPLWCLMLTTGLRPGEALALRRADLDFTARTLTVQRSLSRLKGGRWELTEPKTAQGRRGVPLPSEALEVLRKHQARQTAERESLAEYADDHGLVFADGLGRPLEWSNVRHRHFGPSLRRAIMTCSVCGLPLREPRKGTLDHAGPVLVGSGSREAGHAPAPFRELEGLRPYDLRHLHASLLLARGVSLRTVSERLGHADPGFTLTTYTHLVPGGQEAAAKAIGEEIFSATRTKV